jgi:hypothetical protein
MPSIAGSRVSAASTVNPTVIPAAIATPFRKLRPSTSMPSSATQTVPPANSTARPEVFTAVPTASRTSCPARRAQRKRVTMKSA